MSSQGVGILLIVFTMILMLVLMSRFFSDSLSTGLFLIMAALVAFTGSILFKPR